MAGFAQNVSSEVQWDRQSLIIDGRRVCPVMGEVHYSRIPAEEWPAEIRKIKEGGVTMIATYVFWNHVEEQEGIFNWSGERNLRRFLEMCKEEGLPVVLRMGPFCHALSRLPKNCRQLELRILPLQADMSVYLPREADKTPGEQVNSITIE